MAGDKIPVGILGATGTVGQRMVQLLERHPWFEVAWLGASERSVGQPYAEAARWKLKTPIPAAVAALKVSEPRPENAPKVIFAALDAAVARELEPHFAATGHAVISNSSAFRMQPDVPLVIPVVNPDHLRVLECQQWRKKSGGFLVTNSNCSAMGLALALAPLHKQFGVETEFVVSAQCNRVAVEDGHTESVSVKLKKAAMAEEIVAAWQGFRGVPQELRPPNAPEAPLYYDAAPDR